MRRKAPAPTAPPSQIATEARADARAEASEGEAPATDDIDRDRVFARPDGYHWVALDGRQEFGPFDSIEAALADMQAPGDEESEYGEPADLQEAERDIGIADWIDPETGEPAEGQSRPHLDDE